ncbi:Ribonuclease H domain [Dillenia turbinata]|uniref:Ribonuclease H domain n=1 Tax=Dillenia turbinata TaxID=194707 RepID=A0AAN8ZSK3_9MAGN
MECDSLNLMKVVNEDVDRNHPVKHLISECKTLMKELGIHKAIHIFRETNQCADKLAALGKRAAEGVHVLSHPPEELSKLLRLDVEGSLWPKKIRFSPGDRVFL